MVPLLFVHGFAMYLCLSLIPCIARVTPRVVRATVSAALVISLSPSLDEHRMTTLLSVQFVTMLVAAILTAVPIAFASESLIIAGRLADVARGAQFSEQLVPGIGRVSVLERAAGFFCGVWLLVVDYQLLLDHCADIPRRASVLSVYANGILEVCGNLLGIFAHSFYSGVVLAAPLLAFSFLFDTSSALLGRVMPRFPVTFELLPFRLLGVLACVILRLQAEPTCLYELRGLVVSQLAGAR